jgi:hypothetical protein
MFDMNAKEKAAEYVLSKTQNRELISLVKSEGSNLSRKQIESIANREMGPSIASHKFAHFIVYAPMLATIAMVPGSIFKAAAGFVLLIYTYVILNELYERFRLMNNIRKATMPEEEDFWELVALGMTKAKVQRQKQKISILPSGINIGHSVHIMMFDDELKQVNKLAKFIIDKTSDHMIQKYVADIVQNDLLKLIEYYLTIPEKSRSNKNLSNSDMSANDMFTKAVELITDNLRNLKRDVLSNDLDDLEIHMRFLDYQYGKPLFEAEKNQAYVETN